ncbi:hypothetical protein D9V32_14735 [Mycetocola tolaasinivorans]|uniref:Uncharacterized protein n=1 Tax=Mycetocola tolaasinivorans TaxID=76635 RepID=A0A3L7A072_9MICO|nr:hypothetical protein [Mycetocola tolaasinivorans]RLP73355.1 hypothetical protein D9V32_14735 [Mycetocola tolaasinivorans]
MNANPIFRKSLIWGGLLALAIAVVGGVVGVIVDGQRGLWSALIGTAMAAVFLGITVASILVANRFTKSDLYVPIFFGLVMGGWIVKFVLFLILAWNLSGADWINKVVLLLCLIAGVIGTLVVDCIAVAKGRLPAVSDIELPKYVDPDEKPAV